MIFVWHEGNIAHIGKHGVTPEEAEYVVLHPRPPYPLKHSEDKYLVRGPTQDGRYIQVIFIYPEDEAVDWKLLDLASRLGLESGDEAILIIHARDLSAREKRQWRRKRK